MVCREALISKKDAIRSGAFASAPFEGDAIRVDFEHVDGAALAALLHYGQRRGGETEYGDLTLLAGQRRIWT